jgi:hypothetical protein
MPVEDIEQRLAKLEKALTEIDTARTQLVEPSDPYCLTYFLYKKHTLKRIWRTNLDKTANQYAVKIAI